MSHERHAVPRGAGPASCFAGILIGGLLAACWDNNPCDPNQIVVANQCMAAPPPQGGGSDAGDAGPDGAPAEGGTEGGGSSFGKPCTTAADCSGDAPFCAQPYAPVCTQTQCAAGEANAGACPAGWQCLVIPGAPSACSQM
jgi:hypothetical protein